MPVSPWTKDRVRRLAELWWDGRSAAWIARDLGAGVSRCSVLGKVSRLGLTRAPSTPTARLAPRGRNAKRAVTPAGRVAAPMLRGRPAVALPAEPTRTILTVKAGDCRWPYGEPGKAGFGLCGRPVGRAAFCLAHAGVGYQRRPVQVEVLLADGVPD